MKVKQKLSESERTKIKSYIKNGMDISDLIKDSDLSNEDFTGALIKDISRVSDKINNTKFIRCIIGEEGKITNFNGSNLMGCNFQDTVFKGTLWFRHADLRNCNFNRAVLADVHYQYADLRNISICDTVIRMGSRCGFNAKFEWKQFEQLAQYLNLNIIK